MADSDVIELLNGQRAVYGDSDIDDNFLDENGLPTDTFLDAVKAELEGYENRRRHELQREEMRKAESWKLEANQMLLHKSEDRKKENQYFNRGKFNTCNICKEYCMSLIFNKIFSLRALSSSTRL